MQWREGIFLWTHQNTSPLSPNGCSWFCCVRVNAWLLTHSVFCKQHCSTTAEIDLFRSVFIHVFNKNSFFFSWCIFKHQSTLVSLQMDLQASKRNWRGILAIWVGEALKMEVSVRDDLQEGQKMVMQLADLLPAVSLFLNRCQGTEHFFGTTVLRLWRSEPQ